MCWGGPRPVRCALEGARESVRFLYGVPHYWGVFLGPPVFAASLVS